MVTVTECTEAYLTQHPSIQDGLKQGIINYSKLARKIARELEVEQHVKIDAILIACRRYAEKIKGQALREQQIMNLLRQSELEIKTKIIVAIIDKKTYAEHLLSIEKTIRKKADMFYAIEGTKVFTLITSEKYHQEIKDLFGENIITISTQLAMITLKSPKEMESIPGVISYVSSLLSDHDINIIECMSCWTDSIFVIDEKNITPAIACLNP
jgi:hypothetical protein